MVERKRSSSTTAELLEATTEHRRAEKEDERYENSPLAKLLERMGGNGSAKVFRLVNGKPSYCGSLTIDKVAADNFEEQLASLYGCGDFEARFITGSTYRGELKFTVDSQAFPPKKSEAELRREGHPSELAAAIAGAMQPLLQQQAELVKALATPRGDDSMKDLLKFIMSESDKNLQRAERNADRLVDIVTRNAAAAPAAQAPKPLLDQVREIHGVVKAVEELGGGGMSNEKKGLVGRLIDGPVERGVEKAADRLVDRWLGAAEQPAAAAAPAAAQTPAPPPASAGVRLPKKTRPMSPEEVANWKNSGVPETPAPRVGEVNKPTKGAA